MISRNAQMTLITITADLPGKSFYFIFYFLFQSYDSSHNPQT